MVNSEGFVEFVLEQLQDLGPLSARKMFGGHGVYRDAVFFAIVYDDRLYLKTDDTGRAWFEERGMGPFEPNERQRFESYYEVPADTLENRAELTEVATAAIRAAEAKE